jgi:hypothetical protein
MIADKSDFTCKSIPYGTLEMARATERCTDKKDFGTFCMQGHEDGVLAYGRNLDEVGQLILLLHKKYIK